MDSLSQLLLGAAVGYAVGGKQLGKKSLLIGGFAGTLPDLDVIPLSLFNDDYIMLKHHRGFSHSIIFSLFTPVIFAKFTQFIFKKLNFKCLSWLYFWAFLTHTFLDCFTTWGTQLFWPLSYRVALNSIFIIDPLYTIWLLVGVVICSIIPITQLSKNIIYSSLLISSLYLCLSLVIKQNINLEFNRYFKYHNIQPISFMTRPTPFNLILWSATAKTKDGYVLAFRSLFDSTYDERPKFIPKPITHHPDFNDSRSLFVKSVTNGYYITSVQENGIYVHDLRFGSFNLFSDQFPAFIFTYQLQKNKNNITHVTSVNPKMDNTNQLFGLLYKRILSK